MNKHIIILLAVMAVGCSKDDPNPNDNDALVGHWLFDDSQTDLHMSFKVKKSGEVYSLTFIEVEYPQIPPGETFTYEIFPRERSSNGYQFGEIKINGESADNWIKIRLNGAALYSDAMDVDGIVIEMKDKDPVSIDFTFLQKVQ